MTVPEGPRAQAVSELSWTRERVARVPGAIRVPAGEGQPFDALKVEHAGPGKLSLRLLQIPRPRVRHRRYALLGRVRVAGAQGEGYLEMWSHFPDRGRFFSRTLAPDGPLQILSGTQAWRRFALPFDARGSLKPPSLIELNLVLPGPGTVWLGPVRLVDLEDVPEAPGPMARHRPGAGGPPPKVPPWKRSELWWGPEAGAWVGAVGGGLLGVLGVALFLFGLRPRRLRRVRQIVLVAGLFGTLGIVLGVMALVRDQPADVSHPLLLLGGAGFGLALLASVLSRRLGRRLARQLLER